MRISDWSSDVCSSDLQPVDVPFQSGEVFLPVQVRRQSQQIKAAMLVRCQDDDFSFTRRKVIVVALPETEGLVYGTLGLLGVRNQNATAAAAGTRRRLKLPFGLAKIVSDNLVGKAHLAGQLIHA